MLSHYLRSAVAVVVSLAVLFATLWLSFWVALGLLAVAAIGAIIGLFARAKTGPRTIDMTAERVG